MKNKFKNLKIGYLIILIILTYAILGYLTSASYKSQVNASDSASIAMYVSEISELEIPITDVKPGYSEKINFTVQNSKDGKISEVSQEYTIELKTTSNLPLKYKLIKNNNETLKETSKSFKTEAQELPLNEQIDEYELEISWPTDSSVTAVPKNAEYSLDIDYIKLILKAEQKD